MYVTEHIERLSKPVLSYEIIPPPRGKSAQDILDIVEQVIPYDPPFIDVTSHSAEAHYSELNDGVVVRRIRKKRPGTISICGIIQNRYKVDTVPHILCRGFTREETEDVMIELNFLGIHNVLAIRGDEINYQKAIHSGRTVNRYANELVEQLAGLQRGDYLEEIENSEPIPMCIGVGGYPEKHIESPNMKSEIRMLKQKVEAGAGYVVTQMFFDNADYFNFVKLCKEAGIDVPIIPGIKIISGARQLTSLPKNFHVNLPDELVDDVQQNPKHALEIGERWAVKQCTELFESGVKVIHCYIMNDVSSVLRVLNKL
ncbi:MAG: methylenetetrahydrofolate reductase [candidate division Zixibacteria bacterium]|nr:methylenetetrahydrofolate reductase [candidate division Zixibacteria bacterium]MBU1470551.1 methylenetetrahydrofolate reductase [candidate division Zixibacteria bacterium]MBU2624723.1 methylenetetrahydrofolate reductase [candidate division Zixibacteria bacterium]